MKKIIVLNALAACSLLFSGCEATYLSAAVSGAREFNLFQNPDVNLVSKNYAAADYIIQQAHTFIDHDDVIQLVPLVNFEEPNTPAPIGALIPEQIGARLTQLGYNIDFQKVSAQKATLKMGNTVPLASGKSKNPDFILTGHYLDNKPNLNVSLRIMELKTERAVGAFDYMMPTNREIRKYTKPQAQIMKIERKRSLPN